MTETINGHTVVEMPLDADKSFMCKDCNIKRDSKSAFKSEDCLF